VKIDYGLLVACAIGGNVVSGVNKGVVSGVRIYFLSRLKFCMASIWSSHWHADLADPLADRNQSVRISPH